jgi:hypothetical protein
MGNQLQGASRTQYNIQVIEGSLDDINTLVLDFGYNVTLTVDEDNNWVIDENGNITIEN